MDAEDLLLRGLRSIQSPINDYRLPAPDVRGILADLQIRCPQLAAIEAEVRERWAGVASVTCGAADGIPHFNIHIDPFSRQAQREHWPLTSNIDAIIGGARVQYFFLPPFTTVEEEESFSHFTVFRREGAEQAGA